MAMMCGNPTYHSHFCYSTNIKNKHKYYYTYQNNTSYHNLYNTKTGQNNQKRFKDLAIKFIYKQVILVLKRYLY
mgnify:CR=1 FL=1